MNKEYKDFVERMGSFDLVIEDDDPPSSDDLAHYGILGMKWGVRRPVGPDGRVLRGRAKRKYKQEAKREKQYQKKLSSLSDEEIRAKINRLNMEKQYRSLTNTHIQEGKNIANNVLIGAGKTMATAYIISQTPKVLKVVKEVLAG